MKISIVTISYNQARFLKQTIESVLAQNYHDIEHIVVDAGSTDGSRDIIEQFRKYLAVAVFEPDNGPADGLNKGFALATGDIFFYLNSDDVLLPGALQAAARYFADEPQTDVIYGNGLHIDEHGLTVKRLFGNKWNRKAYVFGAVSVVQPSTFFRGTAFKKCGGFNVNNKTCWDFELLAELELAGCSIKYVSEVFGGYRIYDASITGSNRFRKETLKELARIRQRVLGRGPKWFDGYLTLYCRVVKNIREPGVVACKIFDSLALLHRKFLRR